MEESNNSYLNKSFSIYFIVNILNLIKDEDDSELFKLNEKNPIPLPVNKLQKYANLKQTQPNCKIRAKSAFIKETPHLIEESKPDSLFEDVNKDILICDDNYADNKDNDFFNNNNENNNSINNANNTSSNPKRDCESENIKLEMYVFFWFI